MIISCHTQTVLDEDDALEIVREVEKRGGQFAKIVSLTPGYDDLIGMFRCVTVLKKRSAIPFTVMNVGWASVLGRLTSVMVGSSWVYCRATEARRSYAGQPSLKTRGGSWRRPGSSSTTTVTDRLVGPVLLDRLLVQLHAQSRGIRSRDESFVVDAEAPLRERLPEDGLVDGDSISR